MSEAETENEVLADAVERAAKPEIIQEGLSTLVVRESQRVAILDDEALQPNPRRKIGSRRFFDHDSLASYVNRHKTDATVLYADDSAPSVQAVIDDHTADLAGWGDHTAELEVRKTREWKAWLGANDKFMDQAAFAEHIERQLIDIVEPVGADLLELAQTFQATTKVAFRQSRLLANGQRQFEYVEETDASGGKKGELTIPKEFTLGIAPYEGVDPYRVVARLRYRISEGKLTLGYVLDNPQDVEREAFKGIVADIEAATEIAALFGKVAGTYCSTIVDIVD